MTQERVCSCAQEWVITLPKRPAAQNAVSKLETSKCPSLASHLQPESASPGWIPDLGSTVIVHGEAAYVYPGSLSGSLWEHGLCREGSDPQLALHPVAESVLRMPVRKHRPFLYQRFAVVMDPKVCFLLLGRANGPSNLAPAPPSARPPLSLCTGSVLLHLRSVVGQIHILCTLLHLVSTTGHPLSEHLPRMNISSVSMRSSEYFSMPL